MIVLQRQMHKMMFSVSNLVILVLISLVLFKETECVLEIRNLVVPEVVQNGTKSSIVLDCDYELDDPSAKDGLVVKWFFRNNPTPVYQWIVGKKPQAFGLFKSRLNLSHRASNEETKAHRAMMILNPTIELTGEYMCLVSNFESEKSEVKNMTVFVKEDKIDLIIDETIDNRTEKASKIRIKCEVEDVFPEPDMVIRVDGKVINAEINKEQNETTDLFDIEAFVVLDVKTLKSAVTFDCELSIDDADYTAHNFVDYEVNNGASGLSSLGLPILLVAISIVNNLATLCNK